MTENKIKHLEMIQGVITRTASHSFMLKGWSVTITSALFAFASKGTDRRFIFISFFPALMFWLLDGYFLGQERLYRRLFDKIRKSTADTDFSMDTVGFESHEAGWCPAILSKTVLLFHGAILLAVFAGMLCLTLR